MLCYTESLNSINVSFSYGLPQQISHVQTRSHKEMVGHMSRVTLNFDLSKNSFCTFLARVKTYTHTKN